MILLELFLGFLEIGCFSFGGAYAAIPLIRDVALRYGWMTEEMLTYFVAVSESTPGPIIVNMATFVGSQAGGFLGAVIATLTVILPAFLIILVVVKILDRFLGNPYVKAVMSGLKACVAGIVFSVGAAMIIGNVFPALRLDGFAWQSAVITGILAVLSILSHKLRKKKISPIPMVGISAALGLVIYGLTDLLK